MKSKIAGILFFTLMLLNSAAFSATFKGKVIDADSREPIEGAVVVATWHEERATPAGATSRFKDVKETLTDKNGEWIIKGPKGRDGGNITAIFTFLTGTYYTTPPEFIAFKPGYCSWPAGFGIDACMKKIKPGGNDKIADGDTIELPKLPNKTKREDKLRNQGISLIHEGYDTIKKQENLIRLLNIERKKLGLSELTVLKDLENEK